MTTEMQYRAASIGNIQSGKPSTLDETTRSVEAIGASELPVNERDWDTWELLPTVLLMSGCHLPTNGQLPLLDNHSRYEAASVIGSYRDIRIEGDKMVGRAVFSTAEEAEGIYLRVTEGHITDLSVGRMDNEKPIVIPAGQSAIVAGRTFSGPVRVVTSWTPKEMSVTPVGADVTAKVRAERPSQPVNQQQEIHIMAEEHNRAAVELQPPAAQERSAEVPVQPAVDRAALDQAFARAVEIGNMCTRFGVDETLRAALLKPEVTLDEARRQVMDAIAARSQAATPGFRPAVEIVVDERDKFRAAATDGLMLRGGLQVATPSAGAGELAGYTLAELARRSLQLAGQPSGGSALEMVGRALTASDLPVLLSNVANKSLFEGYGNAEETWQQWCTTGSVNDFKQQTLAMVSEFDDLDQIVNDSGYLYGDRSDAKEVFQIATYGKLFAITRTTIINDDLGGMVDTLMTMGEAAARKVGSLPYAILTANAAMRDSVALFHANHGNLGTQGVVSETTIGEAIKLMKLQKNLKSKQSLNITPQYFIAPVAIEGTSEIFFNSGQFSGTGVDSTRSNPYAGSRFTRIYDPRLDAASSATYYLAGPKGKTVKVFFLGGNQAPYMETRQGWSTDGVEYKVRIDAAAKALDWKALVKNAG